MSSEKNPLILCEARRELAPIESFAKDIPRLRKPERMELIVEGDFFFESDAILGILQVKLGADQGLRRRIGYAAPLALNEVRRRDSRI
jgi:hypothetical protein